MGPRPRIPELSGTPGLDPEEDRRARKQRVPPHSLERHAEDDERVEEGPRDPGDHRHDRRFGHRGPHQRGPPREPPRVRRDEGPGHARRALDRDAPGVLEVLEPCFMDGPNPVRPIFFLDFERDLNTRNYDSAAFFLRPPGCYRLVSRFPMLSNRRSASVFVLKSPNYCNSWSRTMGKESRT